MKMVSVFLIMVFLSLSGCSTLVYNRRDQEMRRKAELARMQREIAQLQSRVADMSEGQDRVFSDVETTRTSSDQRSRVLEDRLTAIERTLSAQPAEREKLRKQIVDDLSRKMGQIMRTQEAQAVSQRSSSGYEHVVKPGETLSEIAAAYGVTVTVIVRENKLKSADVIRVGDKLFIPE
ncbi:MAG: LysM peptidoglycan-binding domain-containing protein [Kiritimatiellia bacterium]|nr:LysM peptidoglycan-binding domain-containing protein [Kiritimatiellia bacterium]